MRCDAIRYTIQFHVVCSGRSHPGLFSEQKTVTAIKHYTDNRMSDVICIIILPICFHLASLPAFQPACHYDVRWWLADIAGR